jgi:acyl carrier protein
MRERIREMAAEVFELPVAEIPLDASNETVEAWDSLRHIELLLAIELEFGARVTSEAMPELLSLESIELYLRENGAAAAA